MTAQMNATGFAVAADGTVTATAFVGPVTGAVTGTASNATNVGDQVCTAVLALAASGAGVATKALTLTLKQADGVTALTTARAATIRAVAEADAGNPLGAGVSTVTFGTATVGSIIASGAGWATILTSAAGAFACTCTDSADETVFAFVQSPAGADTLAHSCLIVPSAFVTATWA
jgi:hypothetical protein